MSSDTEKVRLSLIISPELDKTLNELAHKLSGAKSAVLRRAIALVEVMVDTQEQGKKVGIADKDQLLSKEIIGI